MSKLSWVRGNSVLMSVALYQKDTIGTETAIDLSVYDSWQCRVWRLSFYKNIQVDVEAALNEHGHIVLSIPSSLVCGEYSVEVLMSSNGYDRRGYELPVFEIVESNGEANVTYEIIQSQISANIEMRYKLLPVAETIGKNAYELWKELDGNEDKTLQDYIDEVLNLNEITTACRTATVAAQKVVEESSHPDIVGEDNYVYHYEHGDYQKTDIYVKGDAGTTDYNELTNKPDLTVKADRVSIVEIQGTQLNAEVGKYYVSGAVDTLHVELPMMETPYMETITFFLNVLNNPNITFSDNTIFADDFALEAASTYQVYAVWGGSKWLVSQTKLNK